jgi:hypothetical protein
MALFTSPGRRYCLPGRKHGTAAHKEENSKDA